MLPAPWQDCVMFEWLPRRRKQDAINVGSAGADGGFTASGIVDGTVGKRSEPADCDPGTPADGPGDVGGSHSCSGSSCGGASCGGGGAD